ncbi:MAG: hypothetical protein R3300_08090 [Candidatus Promineifilaceae bacterium]|nr:hypothetical protein [Candidatus Promineifilaceae bacterium]
MITKRSFPLILAGQLLTALLFLLASLRFVSHQDPVGAILFAVTAVAAVLAVFGTLCPDSRGRLISVDARSRLLPPFI